MRCSQEKSREHVTWTTQLTAGGVSAQRRGTCNWHPNFLTLAPCNVSQLLVPRGIRASRLLRALILLPPLGEPTQILAVVWQVWRGALLLADYLLHEEFTSGRFEGTTALELGAGTGAPSMLVRP